MTVTYRIIDPDPDVDMPGCTVTVCEADGNEVWRAWTPEHIDIATVLNLDGFPTIVDDRTTTETTEVQFRVATVDEAKAIYPPQVDPAGNVIVTTEDQHRVIATYAAVLEVVNLHDAAVACELPTQALVDEALAWAAAQAANARPQHVRGTRKN